MGICALSDVALIAAGVAGMGALIRRVPHLLTAIQVVGGLFLLGYGALALRRALRPSVLEAATDSASGRRAVILTTLALTYLNPGVYIDTVILLGSIAATHRGGQWWFGSGAALSSVLWFAALGYGARLLTRSSPGRPPGGCSTPASP